MDWTSTGRGQTGAVFGNQPVAPFQPHEEAARRRRNLMILGVVLVAGFLLPAVPLVRPAQGEPLEYPGLRFVNLQLLFGADVPGLVRLMALYPLLAGVTVIRVGSRVRVKARASTLCVLWALAALVFFAGPSVYDAVSVASGGFSSRFILTIVLFYLAFTGLFVGCRARWYRGDLTSASLIGAAGCVLFLLALVLPTLSAGAPGAPFLLPFVLMGERRMMFLGFTALISAACLVVASGFCLINGPGRGANVGRRLARRGFMMLLLGTGVGGAGLLATAFVLLDAGGFAVLVTVVKLAAWVAGIAALLPFGLTDLLVGTPDSSDLKTPLEKLRELREQRKAAPRR